MKTTVRRILTIARYTAGGLLLLLLLAVGITQTPYFRDRLRIMLISTLANELNGTLHVGSLNGNFLSGFSMDSVAVYYGDEPALRAASIECSYNVFSLLRKTIRITSLTIDRPSIHAYRGSVGDWNIARLFKPDTDTSSGSLEWTIQLEHVSIRDGEAILIDSLDLTRPDHDQSQPGMFDYHNFSITGIEMELSATISDAEQAVILRRAAMTSSGSPIAVHNLTGTLSLGDVGLTIRNLSVQTARSSIQIDGYLHRKDIRGGFDLAAMEHDSVKLSLRAEHIDFGELKCLLHPVDFLEGEASVDLEAEGTFGSLAIKRLNVETLQSTLHMAGTISNLHRPENLNLSILVGDSRINPPDAAALLPSFELPDFLNVGPVSFFTEYNGTPLHFTASTIIEGSFGRIETDGELNLEKNNPAYAFTFRTRSLDLMTVMDLPELPSKLNSRGELSGSGFSLDSLDARLVVNIDSSHLRNLTLGPSLIVVQASHGHLKSESDLHAGDMSLTVNGELDLTRPGKPAVTGEIGLMRIDLESLFQDTSLTSRLNCTARIHASGDDPENITGTVNLTLLPSTLRGHELVRDEIRLTIDQSISSSKRLALESSLADIDLAGSFSITELPRVLEENAQILINALATHANPDSARSHGGERMLPHPGHGGPESPLDLRYTLTVKNLGSVASVLAMTPFNAYGTIRGTIRGARGGFSMHADGALDECFIGTIEGGALLKQSRFTLRVDSLTPLRTLQRLETALDVSVGSGIIQGVAIDSVVCSLDYSRERGTFALSVRVDSGNYVRTSGSVTVRPMMYAIDLDSLTITGGPYTWRNSNDVQGRLSPEGFRIMHAELFEQHSPSRIRVTELLTSSDHHELNAYLTDFDIASLRALMTPEQVKRPSGTFAGRINADLHLTGTAESPVMRLTVSGEDITYRETPLGIVTGTMTYRDREAQIDLIVQSSPGDTTPSLTVRGHIPIDLALAGATERFPDSPQDLHIVSNGFDIAVLEPLVPEFHNLTGRILCDVHLRGTPRKSSTTGSMSIRDARFLFLPNYIEYTVSGDLEPSGEQIRLKNFVISNAPGERQVAEAQLEGIITLQNYQLDHFALRLNGRMILMSDATRQAIPTMYGTLLTRTDQAGVSITGTINRPYLEGTLYIEDADLTFPPTRETATTTSSWQLNYVEIDDTSRQQPDEENFSTSFYTRSDLRDTAGSRRSGTDISLIDRTRYDLNIETQGPTRIRMIFTPSTREELYAELDGKVNAVNADGIPTIYGEISVLQQSYYNFLKPFVAKGKLKFVGPWDNPELDINATYEGYRQITAPKTPNGDTQEGEAKLTEQKVIVLLTIRGTRYEPTLNMAMKVQLEPGKEPEDWSSQSKGGDIQSDVISFILTGKFRDELTSNDKENIISNVGSAAGTSVASGFGTTFLSGILTDFLRKEFPFIRTAEFRYRGGSFQEGAELRLTGEAFKGYWRFGGRILNDISNANVNYQISLGEVFNRASIRNLFIELERKVEGSDFEERKLTNAARIFYRFSF